MKEVFMALVVFAVIGGGVALGVRYRDQAKEAADARPSIASFAPTNLPESVARTDVPESAPKNGTPAESVAITKPDVPETIVVKVLNGGAAGGSAAKVAAYLKANGYTKAETGNANGSNVGIVIYYSADMTDEVKSLQLLLLKQYKGVGSKAATDTKIPEAKTAPLVVVLGA